MEHVVFKESRPVSWHPRPVDLDEARARQSYGALFSRGYSVGAATLESLARMAKRAVWSPICWRGGERREAAFSVCEWMALDFDSPAYTLDEALNDWADTVHVIGVSKNHRREKKGVTCDRFRIVAPWSEPITDLHTYQYNMRQLVKRHEADSQCVDGARFFYPCPEIVSVNAEGYLQPVLPAPPAPPPRARGARGPYTLPTWFTCALMAGKTFDGERNNTAFRLAKDLLRNAVAEDRILDIIATRIYQNATTDELAEISGTLASAARSLAKESQCRT